MSERNYNRRVSRENPRGGRKTAQERKRTEEEVKKIKQDLINVAKTTWGKQWIHSILERGRPFRMQRGIEYAKEDRIDNLSINKGQIFATVQGTAPTPYRVKINFDIIPDEGWEKICKELAKKSRNLVELLEGNLPEDIISIFQEHENPIFLDSTGGLKAECSCPDQAIPCKHIAAIILYIATVLDYNPFLLLHLRGKNKEELFQDLSLAENVESKQGTKIEKKSANIKCAFNVPKINIQEISQKRDLSEQLTKISFHFKKPGKYIETLENLGQLSNLDNQKSFNIVLDAIYRNITKYFYTLATKIENTKKIV